VEKKCLDAAVVLKKAIVGTSFSKKVPLEVFPALGSQGWPVQQQQLTRGRRALRGKQCIKAWSIPAQKMTRTHVEPCTTTITCFEINNLCNIYWGRNIFAWAV